MSKQPKIYHFGKVENGKVSFDDVPKMNHNIQQFDGQEIRMTIERKPKQRNMRSTNQNSYYWGVILAILGDHCGLTTEEMHDTLKAKFLSKRVEISGYDLTVVQSTTDLDTAGFEAYLSTVRMWASIELGCYIPLPNEVSY